MDAEVESLAYEIARALECEIELEAYVEDYEREQAAGAPTTVERLTYRLGLTKDRMAAIRRAGELAAAQVRITRERVVFIAPTWAASTGSRRVRVEKQPVRDRF